MFFAVVTARHDIRKSAGSDWPQAFPAYSKQWQTSVCGRMAVLHSDGGEGSKRNAATRLGDLDLHFQAQKPVLRLQRNHPGREELFYFEAPDLILISSDSAAIMRSIECEPDLASFAHYLAFGRPVSGYTLAEGVRSLPVASELECTPDRPLEIRANDACWGGLYPTDPGRLPTLPAAIEKMVTDALALPVDSMLLSAGLDSSFLAHAFAGRNLAAYTVHYPGLEFPDETCVARATADTYGHQHHEIAIGLTDAATVLETILKSPQPCSAWSVLSHDLVMRRIAGDGKRHVLSGLGADEVLGGYGAMLTGFRAMADAALAIDPDGRLSPLRAVTGSVKTAADTIYTGVPTFVEPRKLDAILEQPAAAMDPILPNLEFYRRLLALRPDIRMLEAMTAHEMAHRVPDQLLRGFEPINRANGLSTHYPFLDSGVYHASSALGFESFFAPGEEKTKNKYAWRCYLEDKLPKAVLTRKAAAYDAPFGQWMRDERFSSAVLGRIAGSALLTAGIVREEWVRDLIDSAAKLLNRDHQPANRRLREQVWITLTLAAWYDEWIG